MATYEIPLSPSQNMQFSTSINGTIYGMRLHWAEALDGGWFLDIQDVGGANIVAGIPLVPGVDLVAPYKYLGFNFQMFIWTPGAPATHPAWDALGATSHLIAVY